MAKQATATTPAEVRAWANKRGIYVGQRGRIAAGVVDAYKKAHRNSK